MFKKKKVKKSIDFTVENINLLENYKSINGGNISNSEVVNYIINLFLGLESKVKEELRRHCELQYKELNSELTEQYRDIQEFEREKKICIMKQYRELNEFFTDETSENEYEYDSFMKRIEIEDGYVIIPDDWLVLCEHKAKNCRYVGVIEFKNGFKYNAPHIIFFSDKPIKELTNQDEKNLHKLICFEFPKYKYIFDKYIPLVFGKDKKALNVDEHLKSPIPGVFGINEYGETDVYPFGAMIFRYDNK